MHDIFSNKDNRWYFLGNWNITNSGIITLYMESLPFHKKIYLITKKDLFMK